MQKKIQKLSMTAWIFIGMVGGSLVGLCFLNNPAFVTSYFKPIGTIYMNLMKFLVVPVVLLSIADGVVSLQDIRKVGSIGIRAFLYFFVTTALAVTLALIVASLFKWAFPVLPNMQLQAPEIAPTAPTGIMGTLVDFFPDNIIRPMLEMNMIPIIFIAALLGVGIIGAGEKGTKIAELVNCASEVVMKMLLIVIKLTPIGVFGLMADVVAQNGLRIMGSLAIYLGVGLLAMVLHFVLVYCFSLRFLVGMRPSTFIKGLAPAMLCAFTTISSNASLPLNIECCNQLGADARVSSFVLPLGATINMDGTAIFQAISTVFIACCYGIDLTLSQMITVVLAATFASVGTAGVSGGGLIMLAMVLTSIGIPIEGIAIVAGVDKIIDMARTTLNVTGDATCALFLSKLERGKAVKA